MKTNEKSNEITAIPELLDLLVIKGCIITIDAMGTQKDIAAKIIEKKADYVLALKDNQKNFHNDEAEQFYERLKHRMEHFGLSLEEQKRSYNWAEFLNMIDNSYPLVRARIYVSVYERRL